MQLKAAKAFRSLLLPVPEKPYRKSYLYRKQMQQDRLPYTLTLIYAYNRPFRLYITYYAAVLFLLQDKKIRTSMTCSDLAEMRRFEHPRRY